MKSKEIDFEKLTNEELLVVLLFALVLKNKIIQDFRKFINEMVEKIEISK